MRAALQLAKYLGDEREYVGKTFLRCRAIHAQQRIACGRLGRECIGNALSHHLVVRQRVGHRHERPEQVGEVVIERSAQRECLVENAVGRLDRSAQRQRAAVGFRARLDRERGQGTPHRLADHPAARGLAVRRNEIAAQRFGFRIALLDRPATARIAGLNQRITLAEKPIERRPDALVLVVDDGFVLVAVVVDDQFVVPIGWNVDAV